MLSLISIFAILLASARLSFWDFTSHRLPNRITLPLIGISLCVTVITLDPLRIGTAVGSALATFLIGWALSSLNALGMGDVKLLVAIALALSTFSWVSYLLALLIGLVSATLFSLVQLLRGKLNRHSTIALGPYLLLGFAVVAIHPIALVLFTAEA